MGGLEGKPFYMSTKQHLQTNPAFKASKLAKEYEKQGGGYENEAGSKNEPKKGAPEHKSEAKKRAETGEDDYEE